MPRALYGANSTSVTTTNSQSSMCNQKSGTDASFMSDTFLLHLEKGTVCELCVDDFESDSGKEGIPAIDACS